MISVSEIAAKISGKIEGNESFLIEDICELKIGKNGCIAFIEGTKYLDIYKASKASVVIASNLIELPSSDKIVIRTENPVLAFSQIITFFRPKYDLEYKIHHSAIISESAELGKNILVSPNVVIEANAIISDNVFIGSNTTIGRNSSIGSNSSIMHNVSLYHDIIIGNNVHIDSRTTIGADGFGIVTDKWINHKIPHTGNVIIKDNVSIGANCCIDRGTINSTIIGSDTKLDNMIQVAHNVIIGRGCIIAGQCGLAGSAILGNNVMMGGQSGVVGHIKVGDKSVIASNTLVTKELKANSFVSGNPARTHLARKKQVAVINRLPDILKRIISLEKRLGKINES